MSIHKGWRLAALAAGMLITAGATSAEPLPGTLAGSWRITRILPTSNTTCWDTVQARTLLGSKLIYRPTAMRWRDGEVPLQDITTRSVSAAQFEKETGASSKAASFAELGIHSPRVLEVDLQHEDADITGATTEVPGDSVLLAGPNRIVVSACGVFFEATRTPNLERTQAHR